MRCQNRLIYTVKEGDTLYRLAKTYHTTVSELILGNPEVNPYNLQVGMKLKICQGEAFLGEEETPSWNREGYFNREENPVTPKAMSWTEIPSRASEDAAVRPPEDAARRPEEDAARRPEERPEDAVRWPEDAVRQPEERPSARPSEPEPSFPESSARPSEPEPSARPSVPESSARPSFPEPSVPEQQPSGPEPEPAAMERLAEQMLTAWLDHVYWMYILLLFEDQDAGRRHTAEEVLLRTADEIADAFALFLPVAAIRQLRNLLNEHVELGGEVIDALRAGRKENYDSLIREWYANLNKLAVLLGEQEPYTDSVRKIRNMLLQHLDLTREEIEYQIRGECQKGVEAFWKAREQAIAMAAYFAKEAAGR